MAAHGWGKSASVKEWLLAEAHRFDFYQAVALLETLLLEKKGAGDDEAEDEDLEPETQRFAVLKPNASVGEGPEPRLEAIRFKSTVSLAFPETDVDSVIEPEKRKDHRYIMKVNFMSLAGAVGPLPLPFAELVLQRSSRHDPAARDFLDIFNHRLVSIAYRIRKLYRVGLGVPAPLHDETARELFSLMGLGTHAFPDSVRDSYRALLHHTGFLSRELRSMSGLESILRHHFSVPIEGVQLTGGFYNLDEKELTSIGPSGKNRTLGRDAIVGTRVWDQAASFEVRVGPMNLREYLRFLPGGDALGPLCKLVRFYVGEAFDFSVCLILKAVNVPATRLGYTPGNMLSYTAWIGKGRRAMGNPEVRLSRSIIERELAEMNRPGASKGGPGGMSEGGDAGGRQEGARGGAA